MMKILNIAISDYKMLESRLQYGMECGMIGISKNDRCDSRNI